MNDKKEPPKMNENIRKFMDLMRDDESLRKQIMACKTDAESYAIASKKVSGFTLAEWTEFQSHMKQGPGPGGPGGDGHRPPPPDGKKPPEKPSGKTDGKTENAKTAVGNGAPIH
ncbi:MAG: Nif11-like leader peptide family natural product precursor [Oscillospiraceae bacterium]|nr:Nif11-like leader peptide family natural product precursor [Oscillospiraceae bacterium]